MGKKKQLGIEINGCLFSKKDEDIDLDDFLDKFLKFVEDNGWHYGGGTNQIDTEGNKIDTKLKDKGKEDKA